MSGARKMLLAATVLAGLAAFVFVTPARSDDAPAASNMTGQIATPAQDLYTLCALYPKAGTCEEIYRRALRDSSIPAQAVRAEYEGYVRYLGGNASLTETDRQYLRQNGIRVPEDLSPADQAGLHNVINDAGLSAEARSGAVNNFLGRAVQAGLYCGFNSCNNGTAGEVNMAAR